VYDEHLLHVRYPVLPERVRAIGSCT